LWQRKRPFLLVDAVTSTATPSEAAGRPRGAVWGRARFCSCSRLRRACDRDVHFCSVATATLIMTIVAQAKSAWTNFEQKNIMCVMRTGFANAVNQG